MKLLEGKKLLFFVIYVYVFGFNIYGCVYWLKVIEDFLVNIWLKMNDVVKVIWYNKIGKLI